MLRWYVEVNRLLRRLRRKALDGLQHVRAGQTDAAAQVVGYAKLDYATLQAIWSERRPVQELGTNLIRHIHFGTERDYLDIIYRDLSKIEEKADEIALEMQESVPAAGIESLLHPEVRAAAYQQYQEGYLRDAVLNAFIAVFDLLRARTGLKSDGASLVGGALSLQHPRLVLSETGSESGQNDQKGFLQILQGAYMGIRNPKAHSLSHDLTVVTAAQYLVFASLLARRIAEATVPEDAGT